MSIQPLGNSVSGRLVAGASAAPDRQQDLQETQTADDGLQQGASGTQRPGEPSPEEARYLNSEDGRKKLSELTKKINIVMSAMDVQAHFSVHEATNAVMIKIVNVETGQTIREIPPKKVLDMMVKMQELVGLLVDERA